MTEVNPSGGSNFARSVEMIVESTGVVAFLPNGTIQGRGMPRITVRSPQATIFNFVANTSSSFSPSNGGRGMNVSGSVHLTARLTAAPGPQIDFGRINFLHNVLEMF